jgi:predicted peptidase
MMKGIAAILLIVCATLPAMGQDQLDGFVARVYKHASQVMPYRLYIPPTYEKSQKYPLIVWLHGAGGAGTDNLRQIQGDQVPGTRTWTTTSNQTKHPAFVVVPQTISGWDSTGAAAALGVPETAEATQLTSSLVHVLAIVETVEKEFHIDSKRLYIAGQSLGGFGTWNLITKKPGVFAAAIILCGGGNPGLAGNVKRMPIWSFQGDMDDAVFVKSNRNMIAAIRKLGGNPKYTEYPGIGHDIWNRVFSEPDLVEWLFAQHR